MRNKNYNGHTSAGLSKMIHHRRAHLVRQNLACWYTPYKTLNEALKVLE